jgi:hypothetical protein
MSFCYSNPIMQDEAGFIACEGVMILIAAILLSVFAPGIFFPQMAGGKKAVVETATSLETPPNEKLAGGYQTSTSVSES